jgi:hypothetical protein
LRSHRRAATGSLDIAADGCLTKAPCGGDNAGPSPVDRRKGGLKRSVATDDAGIPLGVVSTGANRHDSPLLGPTLHAAITQVGPHWPTDITVHLDAGYDSGVTHSLLDGQRLHTQIAPTGETTPVQNSKRWACERTHAWMNGYGQLRRYTDHDSKIVNFYLYLAAAFVTVRALIREARTRLPVANPAHHPTPQMIQLTVSLSLIPWTRNGHR